MGQPSDEVLRRRVVDNAQSIRLMAKVAEGVAEFGAVLQHVTADPSPGGRLPYTYTVGLSVAGLPELLVEALPRRQVRPILLRAVRRALAGEVALEPGVQEGWLEGGRPVCLVEVSSPAAVPMPTAEAYVGNVNLLLDEAGEEGDVVLSALQVVWPDALGRWPWDEGWPYELSGRVVQPVWGNPPA